MTDPDPDHDDGEDEYRNRMLRVRCGRLFPRRDWACECTNCFWARWGDFKEVISEKSGKEG